MLCACIHVCSYMYVATCHTYNTVPSPASVMVDNEDGPSVRVSWQAVDGADRYTVKARTADNQEGLCDNADHNVRVSVDAPSISAKIAVQKMLTQENTTTLRAYTTYSITVVAENDMWGSSRDSEPLTVTTAQTSK